MEHTVFIGCKERRKFVCFDLLYLYHLSVSPRLKANCLYHSQGAILTGAMLETLTCKEGGHSDLSKILLVPEKQQLGLQAYRSAVCSGGEGQKSERFKQMSNKLREQINTERVIEKVTLCSIIKMITKPVVVVVVIMSSVTSRLVHSEYTVLSIILSSFLYFLFFDYYLYDLIDILTACSPNSSSVLPPAQS